jgi:AAA+ ATPase superfamily predicted ATPase
MERIIGRIPELKQLQQLLESPDAELLAIYGRRRVGKTFLIRNAYEKQLAFEFSGAHNASLRTQLAVFGQAMSKATGFPIAEPKNWMQAFDQLRIFLEPKLKKQKKVVFIDEFPWLHTPKSGFREAFEYFWNQWASQQRNLVVVICGSAAAWMMTHIINNRGGLHNRVTRKIRMLPFTLGEAEDFLRSRNVVLDRYQIIQLYMAMGGVPQYLKMIDQGESATAAIERICFTKDGFLHDEFNNLFHSLFHNASKHLTVIKTLAQKAGGLTRNEIIDACKLQTGGGTTQTLDELRESGFIEAYIPFGKTSKEAVFKLIDEFSLFHSKFMADGKLHGRGSWTTYSSGQRWVIWCGIAFEHLCLKHSDQIKNALGIKGIHSEHFVWRHMPKEGERGAQIDLLIDRNDQCINICELKFSTTPFELTKKYTLELQNKLDVFQLQTKTRKALFLTMVTTYGLHNRKSYPGLIQSEVTMDELFQIPNLKL